MKSIQSYLITESIQTEIPSKIERFNYNADFPGLYDEYKEVIDKSLELLIDRLSRLHEIHFINVYYEWNPALHLLTCCTIRDVRDEGPILTEPRHEKCTSINAAQKIIESSFIWYTGDAIEELEYEDKEITPESLLDQMGVNDSIEDLFDY